MKPHIDLDQWPVVVVHWPSELSIDDVNAHFEEILDLASKRETVGIVVDMTASGMPPASLRRHAAQRLREVYGVAGRRVAGVAHVITSPLVRGLLTAVYWLSPPPFSTVVVKTRPEAIVWARHRINTGTLTDAARGM